jgi:hypothetical protein
MLSLSQLMITATVAILSLQLGKNFLLNIKIKGYNAAKSSDSKPTFRRNVLPLSSCWFLTWLTLCSWRWRRRVTPKSRFLSSGEAVQLRARQTSSSCDCAPFRVSGNVNGVNVIGLALQGPSVPGLQLIQGGAGRSPATVDMGYTYQHPLQARGPTREYATNKGKSS